MKILFVSSEVAPYAKVGGLADVCGALPKALARLGHQVVVTLPAYGRALDHLAWDSGVRTRSWLFGIHHELGYAVHEAAENLSVVLLQHSAFHRGGGVYGDAHGGFGDNLFRFALMCRGALEVPRAVPLGGGGPLGEDIVLHAHDWPAALACVNLRAAYQAVGVYRGARAVFTVHNAAHQGRYPGAEFGGLDLAPRWRGAVDWDGDLGLLKAGLVTADVVTAVSPTFAEELRSRAGGFGLDGLFRRVPLQGILNGIDVEDWNPETDAALAAPYRWDDVAGKGACKAALQAELGLPVRPEVPLLAIISRMDAQKGLDSVLEVAPWLLRQDIQLVVLGSGAPNLEAAFRQLAARHPHRVHAEIGFDVPLSRRIYAGADFILVPSRFEPCGLTQLYGMRYGAVPVVRSVGGLVDTVTPWSPATGQGTGWRYARPEGLQEALFWALRTWWDYPEAFAQVRENGMRADWSWDRAARQYEALYRG
ncbi:MAG: glycogen synthase [Alphaproteobacteria bacterium]|nr:glycogen synthase [Alphaproteobacteria bacterium]